MKKYSIKLLLVICCLFGIGLSDLYRHIRVNIIKTISWKISAPIYLNIEIDKGFAAFISIAISRRKSQQHIEQVSNDPNTELRNTILYSKISDLVSCLYLRIPKETARETLNAIDGISVFVGNKMFYFSPADIANMQGREQENYLLVKLPGLEYNRSIV